MDDDRDRFAVKRDRVARLLRIVRYLQERGAVGARPEEIARAIAMSRRTVYRDLHAIEAEVEVPLWSGERRLGPRRGRSPAAAQAHPRRGDGGVPLGAPDGPLRHDARSGPHGCLPETRLGDAGGACRARQQHPGRDGPATARRGHATQGPAPDPGLVRATDRVADLRHGHVHARREPRQARVQPYLIEPSSTTHALYLIGFDETSGALRTFKIERILELALTADRYEPPEAGAIEAELSNAWDIIADQVPTAVVLRFSPSVAGRVAETRWHPSEVREPEPDGSLVWRATVAGTIEIRIWILSWGSEVEVLEPAGLRDDVAGTLRAAAARYDD